MNNRLTLQDLINILAEKQNITKKDAESFLRELFSLISENIEKIETTKIKDFGTFKLVLVSSRKSVDVNTGEDIEIPAHYKLSFLPEKNLREAVNRPFSQFESVLVEDGADNALETAIEKPNQAEFDVDIDIEDVAEDQVEESVEVTTVESTAPAVEVIDEVLKVEEEARVPLKDNKVEEIHPITVAEQAKDETVDEEKPKEPVKEIKVTHVPLKKTYDEDPYGESYKEEVEKKQNKLGIVAIIILLVIAVLGAIYFLNGGLLSNSVQDKNIDMNNSEVKIYDDNGALISGDSIKSDSLKSIVQAGDSLKVEPKTPLVGDDEKKESTKPIEQAKTEPVKPATNASATPIKTISLQSGQTMRNMGLEYYGNKSFWVYIYQENKSVIDNPNSIPIGTKLVIPAREKYGIDPNNPASLKKAQDLERELFRAMSGK